MLTRLYTVLGSKVALCTSETLCYLFELLCDVSLVVSLVLIALHILLPSFCIT